MEMKKKDEEDNKEKRKINRLKLWCLFGFAWLVPQFIIFFLPQQLQILKAIILIIMGFIVFFEKRFGEWFLK